MAYACCIMARRSLITTQPQEAGVKIVRPVGRNGANQPADVRSVQTLLNLVPSLSLGSKPPLKVDGMAGSLTIGVISQFQQASLGFSDGRVDPGGKTLARLNVLTFRPAASPTTAAPPNRSGVVGAPPAAPARMIPMAAAIEATPRAILWCLAANAQLNVLRQGLIASGGVIFIPAVFDMVNTHFHLDRDAGGIMANLSKISGVFTRILRMLNDPSTFYREGVETDKSKFADAPMGGMDVAAPNNTITIRTQYPDCGPMCRSAMLVHEGAHFCGGLNEIKHFAHEFPIPNGEPQDGSTHNYAQMTTSEAMRNASSYAAFAIHVAFLTDHRFGLDKKNV